jgi:hypothetical protein
MQLASELEKLGVTPDDLRLLAQYVEALHTDEASAQRQIAAIVSDTVRLREALEDVRKRPKTPVSVRVPPKQERKFYPGEIDHSRSTRTRLSAWDEHDYRMMARSLLRDGREITEVADATNLPIEVVQDVMSELRSISGKKREKAADDQSASETPPGADHLCWDAIAMHREMRSLDEMASKLAVPKDEVMGLLRLGFRHLRNRRK